MSAYVELGVRSMSATTDSATYPMVVTGETVYVRPWERKTQASERKTTFTRAFGV